MKIALTGSHACGKTTTIKDVARSLRARKFKVEVVEEQARRVQKAGLDLHRDKGFDLQLWVLAEQIAKEIEETNSKPDFILVDRPVYDAVIYSSISLEDKTMTQPQYSFIKDICWGYMNERPYDYIFILGPHTSTVIHHKGEFEELHDRIDRKMDAGIAEILRAGAAGRIPTKTIQVPEKNRAKRMHFISSVILGETSIKKTIGKKC